MKNLFINLFIIISVLATGLLVSCEKSDSFSLARLNKEQDIAKCQVLLKKKKYKKALTCFEAVKSQNFGAVAGTLADLAIADTYFKQKEYMVAAEAYRLFIAAHPNHSKTPYAYYKAGLSYLKETPKSIDRDQSYLDNAISNLQAVVKYYPRTSYAELAFPYYEEALRKKAQKHFYVGKFYFKNKEYLAAIPRFQTVITKYPKLGLDEKSFFYLNI